MSSRKHLEKSVSDKILSHFEDDFFRQMTLNVFALGWEYTANEFFSKRGTKELIDGEFGNSAKTYSNAQVLKMKLMEYLAFKVLGLFSSCS